MLNNLSFPIPYQPSWEIIDNSKLDIYRKCPRKFFFAEVLGWKMDATNIHLHFGSAHHEAMAVLERKGVKLENYEEAFNAFLEYYRTKITKDEDNIYHPKTPKRYAIGLLLYIKEYEKNDERYYPLIYKNETMVEIGGRVLLNINPEIIISYKMDAIVIDSITKQTKAKEHKSGSSSYNWANQWQQHPQIMTYQYVLLAMTNNPCEIIVNGFLLKRTKEDEKKDSICPERNFDFERCNISTSINQLEIWHEATCDMYLDMLEDFQNLSECKDSDNLLTCFRPSYNICSGYYGSDCPYIDFCGYFGNPLQRHDQIPPGFKVEFWNPLEEVKTKVDFMEMKES